MRKFTKPYCKKGFTLVEVIIVLVIIAILAAFLIPSMTGYVDIAHETEAVSDCRHLVTSMQILSSERYAARTLTDGANKVEDNAVAFITECFVLSELDDNGAIPKGSFVEATIDDKGKVKKLVYNDGVYTAVYDGEGITAEKTSELSANLIVVVSA